MMKRTASVTLALAIAWMVVSAKAQEPLSEPDIPLSKTPSASYEPAPLTYAQQTARFESEQRILRMEWNRWIGYDPLRPSMNASYMSNGLRHYYVPSRGWIVSTGSARSWYW